jgi:hypothetical protein
MTWRFRRSVRLAPGFRLNLGKRSASLSVGERGFTTNLSRRGVRSTFSLAGTGFSYVTRTRTWGGLSAQKSGGGRWLLIATLLLVFGVLGLIFG